MIFKTWNTSSLTSSDSPSFIKMRLKSHCI